MACQWKDPRGNVRHKIWKPKVLMAPFLEQRLLMGSSPDELILRKKAIFSQKLWNEPRWRWVHVGQCRWCFGSFQTKPTKNMQGSHCPMRSNLLLVKPSSRWRMEAEHLGTTQDTRQRGGYNWKHTLAPIYLLWHQSMTSHCFLQQPKQTGSLGKLNDNNCEYEYT